MWLGWWVRQVWLKWFEWIFWDLALKVSLYRITSRVERNWAPIVRESSESCCWDGTLPCSCISSVSCGYCTFSSGCSLAEPCCWTAPSMRLGVLGFVKWLFVPPVKSHPYVPKLCSGFCRALLLSLASGITNGSWWWTACEWAMRLSPAKQTFAQYSPVVAEVSARIIPISLYNWWLHHGWHQQWWEIILSVADAFTANLLSTAGALLAELWAQSTAGRLEQGIEGLFVLAFSFGGGMN